VITPTSYTAQHDFGAALRVLPDLSRLNLAQLRQWLSEQQAARTKPRGAAGR